MQNNIVPANLNGQRGYLIGKTVEQWAFLILENSFFVQTVVICYMEVES